MLTQQNTVAIGFGKKSSQKAARRELNRHDTQADCIAPEPLEIPTNPIAAQLRLSNHPRRALAPLQSERSGDKG